MTSTRNKDSDAQPSWTLKILEDKASAGLSFSFSGALEPPKGKSVMLYLLKPTALSALMVPHCSESELYTQPIDPYLIFLDCVSGEVERTQPIGAGCRKIFDCESRLTKHTRFTDGPLSLSRKATFQEYETEDEIESVVQRSGDTTLTFLP